MFDGLTWGAILEQWPFGAAAAVLVIAVGSPGTELEFAL